MQKGQSSYQFLPEYRPKEAQPSSDNKQALGPSVPGSALGVWRSIRGHPALPGSPTPLSTAPAGGVPCAGGWVEEMTWQRCPSSRWGRGQGSNRGKNMVRKGWMDTPGWGPHVQRVRSAKNTARPRSLTQCHGWWEEKGTRERDGHRSASVPALLEQSVTPALCGGQSSETET